MVDEAREREAFETWAKASSDFVNEHFELTRVSREYLSDPVHCAWKAWQARARLTDG